MKEKAVLSRSRRACIAASRAPRIVLAGRRILALTFLLAAGCRVVPAGSPATAGAPARSPATSSADESTETSAREPPAKPPPLSAPEEKATSPPPDAGVASEAPAAAPPDEAAVPPGEAPAPPAGEAPGEARVLDPPPLPPPPEILGPGETWVLGGEPEVTFTPVEGAVHYLLEVARDDRFGAVIESRKVAPPTTAPADRVVVRLGASLEPGDLLHLRVSGVLSPERRTAWRMGQFRVVLSRPAGEGPETPTTRDGTRTVRWSPVPGASGYELEIHHASRTETPLVAISLDDPSTRSIDLPELDEAGEYRWRVRAAAGDHRGDWSEARRFVIESPRCRLLSPADGDELASQTPVLAWRPATGGAVEYELEIVAVKPSGELAEKLDTRLYRVRTLSYRLPAPLERGAHYRARVRERHPGAPPRGTWSDAVIFRIRPDREDPFPVLAVIAAPEWHETRPSPSRDGSLMALAVRRFDAGSAEGWRVKLLERVPGGEGPIPGFRTLDDAGRLYPGIETVEGQSCHPVWGLDRNRDPLLVLATAGSLSSLPGGAIYRFAALAPGDINLAPSVFEYPLAHVAIPSGTIRERVFFEARPAGFDTGAGAEEDGEIWSMRPDATDLRLHTLGRSPAISPDGRTLAFIAAGRQGPEIRLQALAFGASRRGVPERRAARLPPPGRAVGLRGLVWSPRGDHLAFARDDGEGFDLFLLHLPTGEEQRVTGSYRDELDPAFLADPLRPEGFSGLFFTARRDNRSWDIYYADCRDLLQ